MGIHSIEKKQLSAKGMLKIVRREFSEIKEPPRDNRGLKSKIPRTRWRVENETFNTLKNQGYDFEHNFGHGCKHLTHVFGMLMFLAFYIDQVQQHCCGLFQAAVKKAGSRARFWRRQQSIFMELYIASWEDLYLWMVDRSKGKVTMLDTS